jgi:DNA invertase Pin-like site-specific DNA recombinase
MRKAVAYYRVSTPRQGKSGLGLDAQQVFVNALTQSTDITIEKEFFEIESGKKNNRRVLKQALSYCRKHRLMLIFAKTDRLGRDAFYIAKLIIDSGVKFIAADKPHATPLDILEDGIRAHREGEAISKRTAECLQAAKRRGVKLGENAKLMVMENRYSREKKARKMKPIVERLRKEEGFRSERQLMKAFRQQKIRPPREKGNWHPSTVHSILVSINDLSNYMKQDSYRVLFRFICCFTEDEEQATALLAEHYEAIITESTDGKGSFLSDFTRMLQRARQMALQAIKDKPFPGKCWTDRKAFFPLSAAMSETHKEVFCLRFYRGLSEQEIGNKLHLSIEQMDIFLKQGLLDISQQSIIKIPDITEL